MFAKTLSTTPSRQSFMNAFMEVVRVEVFSVPSGERRLKMDLHAAYSARSC